MKSLKLLQKLWSQLDYVRERYEKEEIDFDPLYMRLSEIQKELVKQETQLKQGIYLLERCDGLDKIKDPLTLFHMELLLKQIKDLLEQPSQQ